MAIEDAAENILAEHLAERRHLMQHADRDGVELARVLCPALADMVGKGKARFFNRLPHRRHRRTGEIDRLAAGVLAGMQRQPVSLEPQRLEFADRKSTRLN